MNIIIAGDGEVGFHLAKMLQDENHDITIVDPHEDLLKMLESSTDILTITGDSSNPKILQDAHVNKADLLISVLHEQETNLLTAAVGKKLGAKRTIARVSNPAYLYKSKKELFQGIGVDEIVSPETIAADDIIDLLKQAAATETFKFSHGLLSLFMLKIEENAYVVNKSLNEIAKENPNLQFRAIAIYRNSKAFIPNGEDVFQPNDLAYVITKPEGIPQLMKLGAKQQIEVKNIMIVGGGRIGKRTAKKLEKTLNIKLIENDKKRCELLAGDLDKTLIINGDARDIDLLEAEDIQNMDAFIAVTNNTETNIMTCLHARKLGAKKTIALVEIIDYIDIAQSVGIDTIINKKLITASYISRFTHSAEVTMLKCLSGIDAEVIELKAQSKSPVIKKTIKELSIPEGSFIGGVVRNKQAFIATGDFQINENDKVVVFAFPKAISKVEKLFKTKTWF
ncbi:MAG: Trk system potassium transport protein TrkA [Bacteroidetes bacterium 4484_249]|nr:MAG: Trk system potassium transport protein TrkA [Bacteroidetes bacterium 4484_249]